MFLGSGTFSRRLAIALWMLRALWAWMLVSPLALYAFATGFTAELEETIAKGATWIDWVDEPPWSFWLIAGAMIVGSILIPQAIERRSVARLLPRIGRVVDPSRPGFYRTSPGLVPECSDGVLEAACARYANRLALSFAMLAFIVVLFVLGLTPSSVSGLGFSCRYFWRPMDYLPVAALVSMLVAVQFPTRNRMLWTLQSKAGTNG